MLRSLTRRVVMNKWSAPAALSHPIFHPDLVSLKPGTREYSIVSSPDASYGEAIVALNGLQSNAETLRKGKQRPHTDENLSKVNQYLSRIGLSPSDLNALHAMHVAGTKGKGSTSAFVEQLLRDSGFRTGMFTSPHLISVNERIKIDGIPLTKGRFAEYFWHVYNALDAAKEGDEDMPSYFRMLTVLAFSVFLKENVDVAVIEVGVGGEYDCTNVLPCPKVCIITTLDYDHTKILGNTLGEIAWQKAGILKPDVPCVVAYNQVDEALEVIKKRSVEKKCQIMVAPSFESYISTTPIELGIKGKVQQVNASVAIQAVELWKKRMREHVAADSVDCVPVETLDEEVINSLKRCWLPGRAQIISKNGIKFCLDGAHTVGSLKACMEWFESVLNNGAREFNKKFKASLVFNCTGDRDAKELLQTLSTFAWDSVYFCPNQIHLGASSPDTNNVRVPCLDMTRNNECQKTAWDELNPESNSMVLKCIDEALLKAGESDGRDVFVLVTGSMHLVGGALSSLNLD